MFGISGFELLIVAVFVLIIFGPDKLPQLIKTFSQGMGMFKKAQADMERLVKAEMLLGDKLDLNKAMMGESSAAGSATPSSTSSQPSIESGAAPAVDTSAASVWAATAEDDDEEEDEE